MYSILKSKNEGLKKHVADFARALIATPSASLHESQVAGLVEAQMRQIGFDKVFRDDTGNVVGTLLGREAEPTVLLNCHLDTATPPPALEPGGAALGTEPGRLYGAGAADCKGGLAAQVFTAALLKRSLLPLRGNLVVAATVAEETGGSPGVRALVQHTLPAIGLRPTYAILGEPTHLGLYYGHDGWMEMNICIEGPNPFQVDDVTQAIVNDMGLNRGGYAHRLENEPETFAIHRPSYETVGGFRRATIPVTRRLGPDEDAGIVMHQIKHNALLVAQPAGAVAVEVAIRQETQQQYNGRQTRIHRVAHAWSTDPFHPLMSRARQALQAAGCEVRPGKWQLGRLGMGTAGSLLVREFNLPTVGYGPGHEDQAHVADEYVELSNVTECVYGTAAMVHSLIGIPVWGWTADDI